MTEKTDLAILSTEYGLLVYIFSNPNWRQTHYVFYGRLDSERIQTMRDVGATNFLCNVGWGDILGSLQNSDISAFRRQWLRLQKEWLRIKIQQKVRHFCRRHGKSMRTFVQMDSSISKICRPYHLNVVEDGIVNYETGNCVVGGGMVPFCTESFVEHVYLAGRLPIPKEIQDKTIVVNMYERWKSFDETERQAITKLFRFDYDKLLRLLQSGRDTILLTQPYYIYDECTVEEQIGMYEDILRNHRKRNVIIKPHPGDTIAYEKYFPECYILREKFPFELCYFTKLPIKKIVAIHSTSIYGLWEKEIVEEHSEMLQRMRSFGGKA